MTGEDRNDHTGILVILDAAGRTIEGLENRVSVLTAQVAELTVDRDQLHHLLAEARASVCDAHHVPPAEQDSGQDGDHAAPDAAP